MDLPREGVDLPVRLLRERREHVEIEADAGLLHPDEHGHERHLDRLEASHGTPLLERAGERRDEVCRGDGLRDDITRPHIATEVGGGERPE